MPADDIEITVVVRKCNLPVLLERVPCDAFCLIEQPDGRYSIAVQHDNAPTSFYPAMTIVGGLDDLPERPA